MPVGRSGCANTAISLRLSPPYTKSKNFVEFSAKTAILAIQDNILLDAGS
jgi:hypothetical protein